ncbi:DJ-1/PfpI family protein [Nocardia arthritidis]|uniref:DJ-1/PfpI family protein n=1 Tax=Nocardia arthritidis TaxID=228602 RepID=A0A6G9YRI8_9NOCA|nr:DJ-1/PfpI family protein [Nocardia arthritidis]QIS15929.1 DJ-1/PfpI family protein [Nocardia arthritidis]
MSDFDIAIVLYPGMTALDAIGPYEVLRMMPGARIRFVAHEAGPVITDSGVLAIGATHTFAEVPRPRIILVPGGPAATAASADDKLLAWLIAAHRTSTWTTSVCTGALVLAGAGLLDGEPATTHWSAQQALGLLGAKPQREERVVRTGKIVTAAGVSAGIDLALWLAGEMFGREQAEAIQLNIEYDPRPPFDAGHVSKASGAVKRKALADMVRSAPEMRASETFVSSLTGAQKTLWRSAIRRMRR